MTATSNDSSADAILLREDNNGIARLILNRPGQYNALTRELLIELLAALDGVGADTDVNVVVIAANGKAFCAGHDLKEMRSSEDAAFHRELFDLCGSVMLAINKLPQPVIAEVQGIATAAGCQLVANCDLAVASVDSRFAVSGINVGLFCSTPAVPLSRNLGRKQAMHMLLTGDFISAAEAREYGLVNEVVESNELQRTTSELATKIASRSPYAIKLGKKMFYEQLPMELQQAYAFASERMACNMNSEDAREGVDAFIEKRAPTWKGR